MGLKDKIKKEVKIMSKGAKALPSYVGNKAKTYVKTQVEDAKKRRAEQKELDDEIKKVAKEEYKTAYKAEATKVVRANAAAKAKKDAQKLKSGGGFGGGMLGTLAQVGRNLEGMDVTGVGALQGGRGQAKPQSHSSSRRQTRHDDDPFGVGEFRTGVMKGRDSDPLGVGAMSRNVQSSKGVSGHILEGMPSGRSQSNRKVTKNIKSYHKKKRKRRNRR